MLTSTVHSQGADAILDLLIKKGVITQREANEVREQLDQQTAQTVEMYSKSKVASFLDAMSFGGDLRLRAEYFDNEDQANRNDRWRFRYRLRLGIEAKMTSWTTVGLRLASGDANDPVSTNESFDDTFQKDPIQIDAAYVVIRPPDWDWVSLTGGKMNNPIYQPSFNSPLVYDFDVTPEGLAQQFVFKLDEEQRYRLFVNAGEFILNEIGSSSDTDGYLYDMQAGAELAFGGEPKKPVVRVRAVGGFLWTDNLNVGNQQNDSPNLGNAVENTGNILADFEVLHVGGEIAWRVCERPFLGTPAVLTFSGEYVKNFADAYESLSTASTNLTGLSQQTEGYSGQVAFGGNKKKGEWQIAYQYKYLEADAVYDGLTDSDFGTGGTDRKGHIVKASYNFQDWWQLSLAAIITDKISGRTGPNSIPAAAPDEDLLRIQIDNVFKF